MYSIEEFKSKKWRCAGEKQVRNEIGDFETKPDFRMTKQYVNYCKQRQELAEKFDLQVLRNKLQYQKDHYGEVDPVDYQLYVALIKNQQEVDNYKKRVNKHIEKPRMWADSNVEFHVNLIAKMCQR